MDVGLLERVDALAARAAALSEARGDAARRGEAIAAFDAAIDAFEVDLAGRERVLRGE